MSGDDVRAMALAVHIAAGTVALLLAVVVMAAGARQDWSSGWGSAYVGCVGLVALSALGFDRAGVHVARGGAMGPGRGGGRDRGGRCPFNCG